MTKKFTIQSILLTTLWIAIGAGTIMLLVAAIQKKDEQHCSKVNINIKGVSSNFFVDKKDIQNTIRSFSDGHPVGKPIGSFNLEAIEKELQKNIWIKSAQLFFDNNEVLQVNVLEREPVARVFTKAGTTFYLDTAMAMLPLSDKFSARLPVFTGFPSDRKVLIKADSVLVKDIVSVSLAIQADTFLMALIDQVDITEQRCFEMIPKIGNTIIAFGDGKDAAEKFGKLQLFYKNIMVKAGWNKYSTVNVQFKNQVVASRKGAQEVAADSLRTLQLMKMIAENAERMSADSLQLIKPDNEQNTTNNNLIQQSIERDDNSAPNTNEKPPPQGTAATEKPILPATAPAVHTVKPVSNSAKPAGTVKPAPAKSKPVEVQKPKTLMPKATPNKQAGKKPVNDY